MELTVEHLDYMKHACENIAHRADCDFGDGPELSEDEGDDDDDVFPEITKQNVTWTKRPRVFGNSAWSLRITYRTADGKFKTKNKSVPKMMEATDGGRMLFAEAETELQDFFDVHNHPKSDVQPYARHGPC